MLGVLLLILVTALVVGGVVAFIMLPVKAGIAVSALAFLAAAGALPFCRSMR